LLEVQIFPTQLVWEGGGRGEGGQREDTVEGQQYIHKYSRKYQPMSECISSL
jgi:hypothetical protein